MAASPTLPQLQNSGKSATGKSGVLTIHGFGVHVRMQNGHLEIEDGIGTERRTTRLTRVGHGLKRLVCISEDGFVTLSALKWLADQHAAFTMLDRSGKVSLITGPTASSDARLRRAQALAPQSGVALEIVREIISAKLIGQEQLVRSRLANATAAEMILRAHDSLAGAQCLEMIAQLESQAASAYWAAWSSLPIIFPRLDLIRVPQHWRTFGTRKSALTGSQRLATNPPNAVLNYCYALLECETRLALAALGLDPGMGMLHLDTPNRDSFACDVMEVVRPCVDAWVLDWIIREPFRRSDFFEEKNGNCRLLRTLTAQLGRTMPVWGKLVAPWAEYVAQTLWNSTSRSSSKAINAARLTQRHKREAKGRPPLPPLTPIIRPDSICRICGTSIPAGRSYCAPCSLSLDTRRMTEVARFGRIAAHTPEAEASRSNTQRRNALARWEWQRSRSTTGIDELVYDAEIQPELKGLTNAAIASAIGVSLYYAAEIRRGRRRPHPRHWHVLAKLVGIFGSIGTSHGSDFSPT